MNPIPILQDEQPIMSIEWEDSVSRFAVGTGGITSIVAYGEYGEHSIVTWLAIYLGEEIVYRVPAWQVMISYIKSE